MLRLVRELASGPRVVVVATHDHRMLPLADRVVELVPQMGTSDRPPERIELAAGDTLFRQGSTGDLIYVVASGELEIFRELAAGGTELLAVSTTGDYFGEIGPLFGLPARRNGARARTRGSHRLHRAGVPRTTGPRWRTRSHRAQGARARDRSRVTVPTLHATPTARSLSESSRCARVNRDLPFQVRPLDARPCGRRFAVPSRPWRCATTSRGKSSRTTPTGFSPGARRCAASASSDSV